MTEFRDTSADYITGAENRSSSSDVTILNSLIATLLDSIEGYQKSAEDVKNPRFASLFNDRARERQQVVTRLQAAVAQAGGTPEDESSTLGSMHRMFVDLKAAVTGQDDRAIVNEVERGEDHLKEKFEAAMRDTDLSPTARAAVNEAWTSVRSGHDQMSQLKHGMA